jgi:hypothetical protein
MSHSKDREERLHNLEQPFVGLAYQDTDIVVFRFIIEYNSSLRDFGP